MEFECGAIPWLEDPCTESLLFKASIPFLEGPPAPSENEPRLEVSVLEDCKRIKQNII